MKKKTTKRNLRLAKQTIRRLDPKHLDLPIGAWTNQTYFWGNPNPNPTTSLTC